MKFVVKTNTSIEYNLEAKKYEINQGILYLFDDEGDVTWVIKDWISFFMLNDNEEKMSPDEFYQKINEEE